MIICLSSLTYCLHETLLIHKRCESVGQTKNYLGHGFTVKLIGELKPNFIGRQ